MEIYKNHSLKDIKGEQWKDIPSWEGYYQVSNMGRVKSVERTIVYSNGITALVTQKILRQMGRVDRYLQVNLCRNRGLKTKLVHILVATEFVPNPENKPEVNHKKGIKIDNRASELEWNTKSENIQHSYDVLGRPVGENQHRARKVICINIRKEYSTMTEASNDLNIPITQINAVCVGRQKTAKGYQFKYN